VCESVYERESLQCKNLFLSFFSEHEIDFNVHRYDRRGVHFTERENREREIVSAVLYEH
jgi:hypothetical protein